MALADLLQQEGLVSPETKPSTAIAVLPVSTMSEMAKDSYKRGGGTSPVLELLREWVHNLEADDRYVPPQELLEGLWPSGAPWPMANSGDASDGLPIGTWDAENKRVRWKQPPGPNVRNPNALPMPTGKAMEDTMLLKAMESRAFGQALLQQKLNSVSGEAIVPVEELICAVQHGRSL